MVMKNFGRVSKVGAKSGTAAVSKKPKGALSTIPDVITVYQTSKVLFIGVFV